MRFTNGYRLDLTQTAKVVRWVSRYGHKSNSAVQNLSEILGLSRNHTSYLINFARAMGLVKPHSTKLTALGSILLDLDEYLTQNITHWLIHFNLSINPTLLVWYRLANKFMKPGESFTLEKAKSLFHDIRSEYSKRSITRYLGSEIHVFCQTYVSGDLSDLSYLQKVGNEYMCPLRIGVPAAAFGYAVLEFVRSVHPGKTTIPIQEIMMADRSPGKIFLMGESDVNRLLEDMHLAGVISIEKKAFLNQVRLLSPPDPIAFLQSKMHEILIR